MSIDGLNIELAKRISLKPLVSMDEHMDALEKGERRGLIKKDLFGLYRCAQTQ